MNQEGKPYSDIDEYLEITYNGLSDEDKAEYRTILQNALDEVKDLKKFEKEGPKIMITLRELTIRIVKSICKFSWWRHPNYVKHLLKRDQKASEGDDLDFELP